jgi:quercetin dioxygenase-like cupin family protein
MDIKRVGLQPSSKGPAEWFTGTVRIDPLFQAPDPALVQGSSVTFEAGARTAWHTHPLGQALIVTAGLGCVWSGSRPAKSTGMAHAHHGHDAHCHSGKARRQGCRLDGTGQRRAIPQIMGWPYGRRTQCLT